MQCSIHQRREASGTCSECGKYLCYECVNYFSPPLCVECAIKLESKTKNKLTLNIVLSLLLGFLGLFLFSIDAGMGVGLVAGLLFAGLPWGFTATPFATGGAFATKGCLFGTFFFLGKLIGAAVAGIFVMPFQIAKMIKQIKLCESAYNLLGQDQYQ